MYAVPRRVTDCPLFLPFDSTSSIDTTTTTREVRGDGEYINIQSHGNEDAGVRVPREQRVLAAPRLRVLHVRPGPHEGLVRHGARQLARHGAVHGLHDVEVRREEYVEVALVYLF